MIDPRRRHPRYRVQLAVRYETAAKFIEQYVENISIGGVFVAGAHQLPLHEVVEVVMTLPDAGTWQIGARVVFLLDEATARRAGREPGAGFEIVAKQPGFDEALYGYLLRLDRRREHAVIAGPVPGIEVIADAGYRTLPLAAPSVVAAQLATDKKVLGLVVPPSLAPSYRSFCAGAQLWTATTPDEMRDIISRLDCFL